MRGQILAELLTLCMLTSVVMPGTGITARAAEDGKEIIRTEVTSEDIDHEALYDEYVERLFAADVEDVSTSHGTARRERLDSIQRKIYDQLKEHIIHLAAGNESYCGITINLRDEDVTALRDGMMGGNGSGYLEIIIQALICDMPYEFYWYSGDCALEYPNWDSWNLQTASVSFRFEPAPDYCDDTKSNPFVYVDTTLTGAAANAAANAQAIVRDASGKSLYEALVYFQQQICNLTDYSGAQETSRSGMTRGIVAVFDDDSSTLSSSQSYSRAFKYLCDQWGITAHNADCYMITGQIWNLDGSNSMSWYWNIIETLYGNYVVDVTNSDTGRCGYPDLLFLQAPDELESYSAESRFENYKYYKADLQYSVGSSMWSLYSSDQIGISRNSYQTDLANGVSKGYNGWQTIEGKSYWYEDGVKQGTTGRGKEIYDPDSDAWYWLDAVQGGAKAVSKDVYQESSGGKWVRYDEDGHMVKGWQTTSAGTYYFDLTTGAMAKGKVTIDGLPCWFDEETGIGMNLVWEQVNGEDYYWYEGGKRQGYDPHDRSYRGKEIYDPAQNAWFWLDNNAMGKKAVSKDVYQPYTIQGKDTIGKWVRYDVTGQMIKGWQTTSKGTYYFDPTTGAMSKGRRTIDGKTYTFNQQTGILQ